jgi:hypothetical protein
MTPGQIEGLSVPVPVHVRRNISIVNEDSSSNPGHCFRLKFSPLRKQIPSKSGLWSKSPMELAEDFRSFMTCSDIEQYQQLDARITNFFNERVPEFFDQCNVILSFPPGLSDQVVSFAFRFLSYAIRATALPFHGKIRSDWLAILGDSRQSLLTGSLFDGLLSPNPNISALASTCLVHLVVAGGAPAVPVLWHLLTVVRREDLPVDARLIVLSTMRAVYDSGTLQKLAEGELTEIIGPHLELFYGILQAPRQFDPRCVSGVLMCLRALIPATPAHFTVMNRQVCLGSLLSSVLRQTDSRFYRDVCSLLFIIVTAYYDAPSFHLDPFLELACQGFDSSDVEAAAACTRFWSKICRLEIAKTERNDLLTRIIGATPCSLWSSKPLVQWSRLPVKWLIREFARTRVERLVAVIVTGEQPLFSAAERLLLDLMYCSPIDVCSAVVASFSVANCMQRLICIRILCSFSHPPRLIPEFVSSHHDAIIDCLRSSDDELCRCAISTVTRAVESCGLFAAPDDLPVLVPLFHGLIQNRPSVASSAVVCLMAVLDNSAVYSPAYPLDRRFEDMAHLWSIITPEVADVDVIMPAYMIFAHFVADLDPSDEKRLGIFLDRALQTFVDTRIQDDELSASNGTVRGCCLDRVTAIFRASRGTFREQAIHVIEFVFDQIVHVPLSPIEAFLTVILAASEQLVTETAYFLDRLLHLLLQEIATGTATVLEPAFELMSYLCLVLPEPMALLVGSMPDCFAQCLDPEVFPSATHPGSLRAVASFLAAIPGAFPPQIHEQFHQVCLTACPAAFGIRSPSGCDIDDDDEDEVDLIALSEAIILGFTALIRMTHETPDWLSQYIRNWTEVSESLIITQPVPIDQALLEAYISFLEASRDCSPDFEEVIGVINTLPIFWGIASDDDEVHSRALSLLGTLTEWHEKHP